jgi:hypothetical protein
MKLTARIVFLALVSILTGLQLPALAQANTLNISKSCPGGGMLDFALPLLLRSEVLNT